MQVLFILVSVDFANKMVDVLCSEFRAAFDDDQEACIRIAFEVQSSVQVHIQQEYAFVIVNSTNRISKSSCFFISECELSYYHTRFKRLCDNRKFRERNHRRNLVLEKINLVLFSKLCAAVSGEMRKIRFDCLPGCDLLQVLERESYFLFPQRIS